MTQEKTSQFDRVAAIIGKPGLYILEGVSPKGFVLKPVNGSGLLFVSIHSKKVMLLKDLGIYTHEDTAPLKDVLFAIKQKEEEGLSVPKENSAPEDLFKFLEEVVPNYDQSRVKHSDVKKLIKWYRILKESNLLPEKDEQKKDLEDKPADTTAEKAAENKEDDSETSGK